MKKVFDEDFTEKEIKLIDDLIKTSIRRGDLLSRKELMKMLNK